jgi:ADP-ribose pyrophosphatase
MAIAPPPRMQKWSRENLRVAKDYGIFAVEEGPVRDPSGAVRRNVYTFRARNWCNVIPITREGFLVLIWQYRFGSDALSLEIPGGVIDDGEAPHEAAMRELQEECGYVAGEVEPLSSLQPNPALQGNQIFSYVAWDASPTGMTAFDELEDCEAVLVPLQMLPALLDSGEIQHALCVVALETFLRRYATRIANLTNTARQKPEIQARKTIE